MRKVAVLGGVAMLFLSLILVGQEHPGEEVRGEVEAAQVETAIRDYIKKDEMLKGRFMVYDGKEEMVRHLNFQELHAVNQLDDDTYFVCADFEDQNKNKLDLDFYIDNEDAGLTVSKLLIHKVNGKSRSKDK